MRSVMASAPAKINWTLDILGTDERGYHILDMLMQRVTLYDALKISKTDGGIKLRTSEKYIPTDERNTAYKAAALFFDFTKLAGGVSIYIKKNIPSGAGLAGGSADAAAVLKGLDVLCGTHLSEEELDALALKIGADVPFMLRNGFYRAGGVGEKLEKLPTGAPIPLLIAMKPREPASTKAVYSLYDTVGSGAKPDNGKFINALSERKFINFNSCGGNVLTDAASTVAPGILKNISRMREAGAVYTAMTGSGSAVFGVFDSPAQAAKAKKFFEGVWCHTCLASDCGTVIKELV